MKKCLFFVLMMMATIAHGQAVQFQGNTTTTIRNRGWLVSDTGIVAFTPRDTTFPAWLNSSFKNGATALKSNLPYYYNGTKWVGLTATGADSSIFATNYRVDTMRTRIDIGLGTKLNITDTTGKWVTGAYRKMASDSVFVVKGGAGVYAYRDSIGGGGTFDTTTIYTQLGLRVKYADTASMLTPYMHIVDTTAMLTPYLRKVDTATISSRINLKANIASPTFTGVVTIPTPFTLGATSVTTTGTQLNYLNGATGTTGTTTTNLVYSTSPVLTTPTLGNATATTINTGTAGDGVIFAKSVNDITLASTNHALTLGGEPSSTNMALGEYGTGVGIQGRNNGLGGALHLNPLGGADVRIGSSYAGTQNFTIFNTDAGASSYIEMGMRNGATSADGLLFRTLGTGFPTSGMNPQDGASILTSTNLSGGLSIGTQASAELTLWTNNTKRATWASTGGVTFLTDATFSTGIANANLPNGLNNANQATQSQVVVAGTAYYITRSNLTLPATLKAGMVVGSMYTWRIAMTKTGAGTGAFNIIIYRGTNGTTADVADVTQSIGTQTAVVDNMVVDINVVITATGATGSYFWNIVPVNKAVTATGFGVATGTTAFRSGTVAGVALNTSSLIFGIGFSCAVGTPTIAIPMVQANVNNLD